MSPDSQASLIRAVLLLHALAFAYVAFEPFVLTQLSKDDALEKLRGLLAPGTVSLATIALARLVLLGLIPARLRDRLIHWRWKHPLPGAQAFSRYGPSDSRVDMSLLQERYGPLPTDQGTQGSHFYQIYRANDESVEILDAHRSYLAARDIGTINFLMLFVLPGLVFWATSDL